MTGITTIFTIAVLALIAANLILHLVFIRAICMHLQDRQDIGKEYKARHLADMMLLSGLIACSIWSIVAWGALNLISLPHFFDPFITIGFFSLLVLNLYIPVYFEERTACMH